MPSFARLSLVLTLLAGCASEPTDPPAASAGTGGAGMSGSSGQGGQPAGGAGSSGASGQPGTAGVSAGGAGGQVGAGGPGGAGAGPAGAGGAGMGGAGQGGAGAGQGGAGMSGTSGQTGTPVCGDGVKATGEACDGGDLGGATCGSLHAGGLPPGPDGVPVVIGGLGQLACTSGCAVDTGPCDPPVRSFGGLTGAPPEGGESYYSEYFLWDAKASVFRASTEQRTVVVPAGVTAPAGITLLAFGSTAEPWTLPAGVVLPDYPYVRVDTPGALGPLYDPCWDHACEAPEPPRPLRPKRSAPVLLRQTGEDAYVPGINKPWVHGRGKLRLVVAVAYADAPMPASVLDPLLSPEGVADSTSLAAIPPWYGERTKGLPSPVDVEIVWSKVQVKIPAAQIPTGYDACILADWKPLLAPSLDLSPDDVLVQVYWAADGASCASHALRDTRSFVLFATPSSFSPRATVISGAHELMHLLGASDKYTETGLPNAQGEYHGCWFADSPLYDPRDIMCHRVAQYDANHTFTGYDHPPLHELIVAPLTAREVGWEDLDGDGVIEIEDACPWDGGC